MCNKSSNNGKYSGMISLEDIVELAKRKDAGDKRAREKLIVSHLWCVEKYVAYHISTIDKQIDKHELYKDLYQEGCFGLIRAVDNYDWKKGVYLSTYAKSYIKKYVLEYCSEKIPYIRLPAHIYPLCYKYMTLLGKFMEEHQRIPTFEESAEALEVSLPVMKAVWRYQFLLQTKQTGDVNFVRFDDELSREYIKTPEDILNDIFPFEFDVNLKQRERDVLIKYFGLDGNKSRRFKEIGEEMNISDEMARRAYHSGIKKLQRAAGVCTEDEL